MNKKNLLRGTIITLATAVGMGAAANKAEAQVTNGSVEAIVAKEDVNTYGRATFTYKAPLDIRGFSFIELSQEGTFYGKSLLTKTIKGPLTAEVEAVHADTPISKVGFGVGLDLPMPKNGYANIKALPAWIKGNDQAVRDMMAGYTAGYSKGRFNISSFGYYNLTKGEIDYGEIEATVDIVKGLKVGVNPCYTKDGKTFRFITGIHW